MTTAPMMVRCTSCGYAHTTSIVQVGTAHNRIRDALTRRLDGVPDECFRLFSHIFLSETRVHTVKELGHDIGGVHVSTLTSRFWRARLPAARVYLVEATLVHAAMLLDNPRLSANRASIETGYSSSPAFFRMVRTFTGLPVSAFRYRWSGDAYLEHVMATRFDPHLAKLRRFRPCTGYTARITTNAVARPISRLFAREVA